MKATNLYAKKENGHYTEVIMPDQCGEMKQPAPTGEGWYAVRWPLNPHFTGSAGILCILNSSIEE